MQAFEQQLLVKRITERTYYTENHCIIMPPDYIHLERCSSLLLEPQ